MIDTPPAEAPFLQKLLLTVLVVVLAGLLIAAVLCVSSVWLLVFSGILLALLLQGLSEKLRNWTRLPAGFALAVVALLFPSLAVVFFVFGGRDITEQFQQLGEEVPKAVDNLYHQMERTDAGRAVLNALPDRRELQEKLFSSFGQVKGMAFSTLGAITDILIVIFLGLYLAATPAIYNDGLMRLFPPQRRDRAGAVLHSLGRALKWWLVGRIASMALVAVLTTIGLYALDVPLALPLGLLAGLLSFVPNLGPIISAVPAIVIGFMEMPTMGLYVLILYVGIQTVESYLITPIIQLKAVSIPPALLLTMQIFFGMLAGIPGLFLATPLTVTIIVIAQHFYIQDVLGDDVKVLGS